MYFPFCVVFHKNLFYSTENDDAENNGNDENEPVYSRLSKLDYAVRSDLTMTLIITTSTMMMTMMKMYKREGAGRHP